MSHVHELRRFAKLAKEYGFYERFAELSESEPVEESTEFFALKFTHVSYPYSQFLRNLAAYTMGVEAGDKKLANRSNSINGLQTHFGSLSESTTNVGAALDYGFKHYKDIIDSARSSLCRMYLISLASAFEAYIHDVVLEVFRNYPSCMRSEQKTITYSEVLGFSSLDDVWNYLAALEADKATNGPAEEYLPKLGNRLGIIEFEQLAELFRDVSLVFAVRNLLVHKDGVVDRQFLRRYSSLGLQVGDKVVIERRNLGYISMIVRSAVEFIETMLCRKFPTIARLEWNDDLELTCDHAAYFEIFPSLCQSDLTIIRTEDVDDQD